MLLRGKRSCQRNNLLLLLAESPFQQRMTCLADIHLAVVGNHRHSGDEIQRHLCLRHKEIYLAEITCGIKQIRNIRAEKVREFQQDAQNLPLLRELEFLDLVVELHDFRRLDECGLSCRRLVIDESCDPLLVGSAHRNEHLAVAHRHTRIAVNDTFFLCLLENGAHPARNRSFLLTECLSYIIKFI